MILLSIGVDVGNQQDKETEQCWQVLFLIRRPGKITRRKSYVSKKPACMIHLSNSGEKDFQAEGNTGTKASRQIRLTHLSNSQELQSAYSVGKGLGWGE